MYIHVPFCFHKCHYCDFYSFVDQQDRQDAFADALIRELARLAERTGQNPTGQPLRSVFVGGGTPTLLRPEPWVRVLAALHDRFAITGETEFTVESNPETTTPEVLRVLVDGGVNRVSIGAQSFNPTHLKTLERHHDPANVRKALDIAQQAGIDRRSIDLIFAIPGQTVEDWRDDLDKAVELGDLIEHVSAYNLMYEPNTALTMRLRQGQFDAVGEDTEIEMFRLTRERLGQSGLEAYEISNYARPGGECGHNLAYWRQEPWLAAGPSASAHVNGWRWKNVPRLTDWMDSVDANGGFSHVTDLEPPDERRALAEALMTGIRLTRGFDAGAALDRAASLGVRADLEAAAASLVRDGIITIDGETYALTEDGLLLADEAGARFIEALATD